MLRTRLATGLLAASLALTVHADARVNYLLHCGGCHRVDGRGLPPEVPTLVGSIGPLAGTAEGRDYLARVPGAAQAPISDAELAAVLNWILEAYNADTVPVNYQPLTAEEISASRPRPLADPRLARNRLGQESISGQQR